MQIVHSIPGSISVVPFKKPAEKPFARREEVSFIAHGVTEFLTEKDPRKITMGVDFVRDNDAPDYSQYPARQFARILMGPNFYGPEEFELEMQSLFLTPEDLSRLANVPWTKEVLESPCPFNPGKMIKETHALSVGSILHPKKHTFWLEWILAVKNPSFLEGSVNLPPQYMVRRATDYQDDGPIQKILARFPEM